MGTHFSARQRLAAFAAAILTAAGLLTLTTPGAEGQASPHAIDAQSRVHWSNGKALGQSSKAPGQAVRAYVAGHGLGRATANSLRPTASWSVRGVGYLRMQQYVDGLRVAGSDIKAAFDSHGRLIALVENASRATAPRAAKVSAAAAQAAAVRSLYPAGSPRWLQRPTVEKVAVPMSDGRLSEGYVVTTWDASNRLNETLVAGNGSVVSSMPRTASDAYNIFPESPDVSGQTLVSDPADATASPSGWLSGAQFGNHISGNNAQAYLDRDNDNAPDANDAEVTDGVFDAVANLADQPTTADNQDVAVQNLFYLNNLIHDTLYHAGFTEAAGNFQQDNFGNGGAGGDPVLAEAQDGGGTDNANFSTPTDGQSGRMQMYLFTPPGGYEVVQGATSYAAAPAEFGKQLDTTGVTGPLVIGNDGAGVSPTDGCERLPKVAVGSVVLVDRGNCNFTVKAVNVQRAGGAAVIVANNAPGPAVPMGADHVTGQIKISALMVSQDDGVVLKTTAGTATTLRLSPTPPAFRDGDVDSDIVWHEYGHGLTWRMIGSMGTVMSGAIGEGMSDVLAVIVNDDPIVAEYSVFDPRGFRSESYEGYSRTYGDVVGEEVHFDGELYGAIGWDLWKSYQAAALGQADILEDLVGGMNFTPAAPAFEDMRDGILMGLTASGHDARACMVWNSFAKYGVGVGASSIVRGPRITTTESFAVPPECAAP